MPRMVSMACDQCGRGVKVKDRPDLNGAFCCPLHAAEWQFARTEEQIRHWHWNGARCQWCGCRLHTGYHEEGCPVRDVKIEHNYKGIVVHYRTAKRVAEVLHPASQYWGDPCPADLPEGEEITQEMYDNLAAAVGNQVRGAIGNWVRKQIREGKSREGILVYDAEMKRWDPDLGTKILYYLGIQPENRAVLELLGNEFIRETNQLRMRWVDGWQLVYKPRQRKLVTAEYEREEKAS
jgi:hypothetical protein